MPRASDGDAPEGANDTEIMVFSQVPRSKLGENQVVYPSDLKAPAPVLDLDLASRSDVLRVPMSRHEAKKLALWIVEKGTFTFSPHSIEELKKDRLSTQDALNVIRCGHINDEGETEKGSVRYRVETPRMVVVVAFRSITELRVVTAWRK